MKVKVYKKEDLVLKFNKDFKPLTERDIEICSWLCSWSYVTHSSGQIVKCEGTVDDKWRILGKNACFPMAVGQMVLQIKKPAPKKQW